ncbi:sterol desaturase family protein [Methylopila sp. M107]|uniref:sterol desaturase family protein n=1 Tax=Methylopila sp. M107 TaxID=1101190 RepID=UPI00036F165B|nr:sterol desaturase family protein [Methylopila sp. M107]
MPAAELSSAGLAERLGAEASAFAAGVADLAVHIAGVFTSPEILSVIGLCAFVVVVDFVRRGFRAVWPRRIVEGSLATLAIVAANLAFGPLVMFCAKGLQTGYDALHIPSVDPAFWAQFPKWALVPLAILAYDVANYWNHRAMHMRWLWPVHAVHHSEPEITGLSVLRVHGLEALVMMGSYTLLLSWLGFPPDAMGGAAILLGLHNAYVHVNVDWGHGLLARLIASPRFHRWHHADVPEAHGKNLANVFPFLDVLFGTYYVPGRCEERLGAEGVPENDVARLVLFPFVAWAGMIAQAFRRAKAPGALDNEAPVA